MKRILFLLLCAVGGVEAAGPGPFGDIPASLSMGVGQSVRRNAAGTGFESYTPSAGVTEFIQLSDVPNSYSGEAYKVVQVNSTGTGLQFSSQPAVNIPQNFTDLNDVPATYVGFNGRLVLVNSTATGLIFASPTPTPTATATATATSTPTATATATATPTASSTATATATATATPTPTPSATATPTATAAAPEDAHYVTTQAETGLSNEFSLGTLGSGILYQGVSATISTPAIVTVGADLKFSAPNLTAAHAVTFSVDGIGILLITGTKNPIKLVYGGTLVGWTMVCKPSGSVTADVFRAADGAGLPVTSIVGGGGTKPAIASDVESSSTNFTGWTSTTLTAKDNLAISLSGITTSTFVTLTLYYK